MVPKSKLSHYKILICFFISEKKIFKTLKNDLNWSSCSRSMKFHQHKCPFVSASQCFFEVFKKLDIFKGKGQNFAFQKKFVLLSERDAFFVVFFQTKQPSTPGSFAVRSWPRGPLPWRAGELPAPQCVCPRRGVGRGGGQAVPDRRGGLPLRQRAKGAFFLMGIFKAEVYLQTTDHFWRMPSSRISSDTNITFTLSFTP